MGEPTHEVVQICNGVARSNIKILVTTIISVCTIVMAGWIGWVSHSTADHGERIRVIENVYPIIKDDVRVAKETIAKSAEDLAGIKALLSNIRQDQIDRAAKAKKQGKEYGG